MNRRYAHGRVAEVYLARHGVAGVGRDFQASYRGNHIVSGVAAPPQREALGLPAVTVALVDAWLRRAGELPHPQMELDSVEALKEMAAIGLGYAVIPRMAMQGRGAHDDLVSRPLTPKLQRTLAMVLRKDKPLSRPLSMVREYSGALCAVGETSQDV